MRHSSWLGALLLALTSMGMVANGVSAQDMAEDPDAAQYPPPSDYPQQEPPAGYPQQEPPAGYYEQPAQQEEYRLDERTAKNAVYLELGGNAILYSLNYERFVLDDVSLRVGFGFLSFSGSSSEGDSASVSLLMVPLMVNYLGVGSGSHRLELGAGVVAMYVSGSFDLVDADSGEGSAFVPFGSASIGYRFVPLDGGFNFKVSLAPIIGPGVFLPWFGVAFGAAF